VQQITPEKAWCNLCTKEISASRNSSGRISWSNVDRHFDNVHKPWSLKTEQSNPFMLAARVGMDEDDGGGEAAASEQSKSKNLADKVLQSVASMALVDGEVANLVAHPGMKILLDNIIGALQPGLVPPLICGKPADSWLPSWYKMDKEMVTQAERHIGQLATEIAANMRLPPGAVGVSRKFNVIADCWDDGKGCDIFGVGVKICTREFDIKSYVIAATPLGKDERHTAEVLRHILLRALARVRLDWNDAHPTSDAGAPMPQIFKLLPEEQRTLGEFYGARPDGESKDLKCLRERWARCMNHLLVRSVEAAAEEKDPKPLKAAPPAEQEAHVARGLSRKALQVVIGTCTTIVARCA
jgi:hypothetical protein